MLFIYAALAALTIYYFDGTGDAGDSIQHYLYGKYAPLHPELFFDHWAKPFYVLLISPFVQFGFIGAKVFNALASLATIFLIYKTAEGLGLKNPVVAAIIAICAPMYYILTFSGLTEPLFALFIAIGLYTCLKENYAAAALVVSFLPFVRSEGLIIIGVFALYFLVKKKYTLFPLLLAGHFVYSVAGYFVYHDLFWVFTKIPYANMSSQYGHGSIFNFATGLLYVVGVPIYALFWIGLLSIILQAVKRKINPELHILVLPGFLAFFIAHSLFWYLGIFSSMGVKRVLVGVMPMIAIIALQGFNFITEDLIKDKRNVKLIFQGLLTAYIVTFPFTDNPAAILWEKDMRLSKDQQAIIQTVNYITEYKGLDHRYLYSHPYLSEVLNIDPFDKNKRLDLNRSNIAQLKPGDIIVWENWFAPIESGITKEQLDHDPRLANIFHLSTPDNSGHEKIYSAYELKEEN